MRPPRAVAGLAASAVLLTASACAAPSTPSEAPAKTTAPGDGAAPNGGTSPTGGTPPGDDTTGQNRGQTLFDLDGAVQAALSPQTTITCPPPTQDRISFIAAAESGQTTYKLTVAAEKETGLNTALLTVQNGATTSSFTASVATASSEGIVVSASHRLALVRADLQSADGAIVQVDASLVCP